MRELPLEKPKKLRETNMDYQPTPPFSIIDDGKKGVIIASKDFFERDCVLTVANSYTGNYWVSVQPIAERNVEITVSAKNGSLIDNECLKEIMNGLIDHQVRLDLVKEFGGIRKTIVDYAFSSLEKDDV